MLSCFFCVFIVSDWLPDLLQLKDLSITLSGSKTLLIHKRKKYYPVHVFITATQNFVNKQKVSIACSLIAVTQFR